MVRCLWNNPTFLINTVGGCIISDSRNVYDKLSTEELSTKGAERRTDIELLCVKCSQKTNHTTVRWVHSEAQVSNALTKVSARELEHFYRMGHRWRIVHDPSMKSSRRRRSEGISTFQQNPGKTDLDVKPPNLMEDEGMPGDASAKVHLSA